MPEGTGAAIHHNWFGVWGKRREQRERQGKRHAVEVHQRLAVTNDYMESGV